MAKKPAVSRKKEAKAACKICGKPEMKGCRGLCYLHWKAFRRDRARVGAAIKKLTAKDIREGLTLEQKRKNAMQVWDAAQVALGRVRPGHRGLQANAIAFGDAS